MKENREKLIKKIRNFNFYYKDAKNKTKKKPKKNLMLIIVTCKL